MKIKEILEAEKTAIDLMSTLSSNTGNIDIFGKMKFSDKESPCEHCGYINCACSFYRYSPQNLLKEKINE